MQDAFPDGSADRSSIKRVRDLVAGRMFYRTRRFRNGSDRFWIHHIMNIVGIRLQTHLCRLGGVDLLDVLPDDSPASSLFVFGCID